MKFSEVKILSNESVCIRVIKGIIFSFWVITYTHLLFHLYCNFRALCQYISSTWSIFPYATNWKALHWFASRYDNATYYTTMYYHQTIYNWAASFYFTELPQDLPSYSDDYWPIFPHEWFTTIRLTITIQELFQRSNGDMRGNVKCFKVSQQSPKAVSQKLF